MLVNEEIQQEQAQKEEAKKEEVNEQKMEEEVVVVPKKNYIFKYNKTTGVTGYQPATTDLKVIKNLSISDLGEEVRSGWVKFANNRNDKQLNRVDEAKWVLRFPKGHPDLNKA